MSDSFHRSVRLSDAEQQKLFGRIRNQTREVSDSQRTHDRIECYLPDTKLEVSHPDGEISRFLNSIRNLSTGGLSFIHGGFLYPGSKIKITLSTVWGSKENVAGKIVNCRLVEKQSHEIGVKFIKPIDRRRYLTLPDETPLEQDITENGQIEIDGTIAYFDKTKADAMLTGFHLKSTKAAVVPVCSRDEFNEQMQSAAIDAVIINADAFESDGVQGILDVRECGFKGPILCVIDKPDDTRQMELTSAGASGTVTRPLNKNQLIIALSMVFSETNAAGSGPVVSELASNPEAAELIEYYLGYAKEQAAELEKAIQSQSTELAQLVCESLIQSAPGYGFSPVELVARQAADAISSGGTIPGAAVELRRLISLCGRLQGSRNEATNDSAGVRGV